MNLRTFRSLRPKRKLLKSSGPLDRLGGALNIVGQFTASTLHKQRKYFFNIHIARGPTVSNLSGREIAVERRQVSAAAAGHQGTLKTDLVKIHLREGAVP